MSNGAAIIELMHCFDVVKGTRGKKAKVEKIKELAADEQKGELFKKTLHFVYNPFIVTGLAKKKMNKDFGVEPMKNPDDIDFVFQYLRENNTGSDLIVRTIQMWILAQPKQTHEFLKLVFTNDIQIGASAKSINKALGENFIPIFEVQLAHHFKDHYHKIDGEFSLTCKMNGTRAIAFNSKEDGVKIFTRKGQPITGCLEVEEQIAMLPKGYVYDGELCNELIEGMSDHDLFRLGNGKIRKDGEKTGIRFVIFDLLTEYSWEDGVSELKYKDRMEILEKFLINHLDSLVDKKSLLEPVPRYYTGNDLEVIPDLLDHVVDELGLEGLMLNTTNSYYVTKRTDQLLKIKKMKEGDFRIVDYVEHKHGNKLGSFVIEFKGNTVRVGTGINKEDEKRFWADRENMIGRIIEVHYQEESKNKQGEPSLQFPAFKGVRWDKDEPNY